MRYEIKFEKDLYDLLSDIQHVVWRLKNRATTSAYDWQQFSFSYNERFGEYPKAKEILGKSQSADAYGFLKDLGSFVSTSIVDTAISEAIKKFEKDKSKILKGEEPIQQYRRDGSFPIRSSQIKNLTKVNNKKYTCKLSLLSREGAKERNCKGQIDVELRTGKGAYEILDRIIEGSYKLCDSRIAKNKNKFYLLVTYSFESKKVESLDKNRIMGIDLGVNIPAMLAISDNKFYCEAVGDSKEIRDFQNQIESRKRRLQKQRKWCGEGSIGHGTKTRIKPLKKLSGKIKRFKDTKNHCWSRYIIEQAVKHNCGVIQMENLKGINKENTFLNKLWTYYDLQQKIKYKAEEKGIKVVMINPYKTSQRCSCCGYISKENRDAEKDQAKFECVSCETKMNADWNAAKNIATPDIENIIKKQLEKQEKEIKHNIKYVI